ncbi:hypothetical protein BJV74DRAFT_887410 [Russula compacta]|nr:hypothetical protein BJV74DRAFT_887410 [Russula compacta]
MVHRPSDLRLLNSLLSNEKEYHKHLLGLLDNYSQQSLGAFAAYASASPASLARAVIAVAGSFAGADDALRRYAVSIEAWQADLRTLKSLEEDVGNVIRDREILFEFSVTRLIKLSKNQKPTRDSFISTVGASAGEASQISLSSFTSAGVSSSKLGAAQAELQACEAHLVVKEKELDQLRVSAVRRGLEARCKAMVECGWNWSEMGREGLRALEEIENFASNGTDVSSHKRPPDPDRPPGSDLSSIGPSQSASQIDIPALPLAVPTDLSTSTPSRVASPAPVPSRSTSPRPSMPPSTTVTLNIPPAHSISELALPSTLVRRISEEFEDLEQGSSEEDSRPVEVVENARNTTSSGTGTGTGSFSQTASSTLVPTHHSVSPAAPERERKASGGFFSSIAGLFRGGGSAGSGHFGGTEKWKTRTETNLRAVRREVDSDSDDGPTESPTRRLFGRRASQDNPPRPSPAAAQKLRKRPTTREKEKDEGWISDGAAVRGPGARKGSARKRSALPNGSSRSVPPPSVHSHLSSAVSATPSFKSAPAPSTPSRAKPSAKSKPDLRVDVLARSSNTNVSRQSSLRISGSAPPVRRSLDSGMRTAGLPSLQSTPSGSGIGRRTSLVRHEKSRSVTHTSAPPPPLHADAGRAGSDQMSLMAIVEGVTRNNRAAWDRANAGLPLESVGGTNPVGHLLSVRAPPSVTKYNIRGESGHGIAFESVLAPGSVLAAPPPLSVSTSAPQRSASLPPPPRLPIPATPPGTPPKIPLRSALRNHTPSPVPRPIVIPSAPARVVVESPVARAQAQARNGKERDREDEGSDSGSIASFRTVRETLDEVATPVLEPASVPSTLAVPGQDESDVSTSTISVGGGSASGSGPARRKSVRVSLQPTFSPTPPALDEDEDETWERSGRPSTVGGSGPATGAAKNGAKDNDGDDRHENARGKSGRERDFWADSSDEDEEYSRARKMLTRAGKKRW